jgi:hypothetical protein
VVDIEGKVSNLDMVAEGRAVTIVIRSKVGEDLSGTEEEQEKQLKEQQKKEREAWEKVYVGAVVKGSLEVVPPPPPEEAVDPGGGHPGFGEPAPGQPEGGKPPPSVDRPPDGGRPVTPKNPGLKR